VSRRKWAWIDNTTPFSAIDDVEKPASFVVEQISDTRFRIPAGLGFQYNFDRDDLPPIRVDGMSLDRTDFASIPRYMAWLVSRYGRHTPAVLVHDQLVTDGMPFEARKRADDRFLAVMDQLEVPPVQSRVMWAAVSLATLWRGTVVSRARLVIWAVLAVLGLGLLGLGIAMVTPWMIVLALVAPLAAAALWGDHYWAGAIAGYALPIVAVPALAALAGYLVYWMIERTVKAVRERFERNQGKELPDPAPYQGR
jgi:hypothetical protein